MRSFTAVALLVSVLVAVLPVQSPRRHQAQPASAAQGRLEGLPSPFVPNLGQWQHQGKFIHRAGPMTMFLEDRGWVLDLVEPQAKERPDRFRSFPAADAPQRVRGVALRMTFEGDAYAPEILGEEQLPGHHNYFLGNDESCWRTGVPLYASVRYQGLYPGIDLRLRQANGVPDYDLLLEPGADHLLVSVHVEGGKGLSIADDGSLVVETKLGPLTQPRPKTFEVGRDGRKREVACHFRLLGPDRFGFLAPGWEGDTSLAIDPGLIWSTFLGGNGNEGADGGLVMSVDASGMVTVGGTTASSDFPMTTGAYNRAWSGGTVWTGVPWRSVSRDAFLTCLDPSKTGTAQLVYSTFLGGNGEDWITGVSVGASGVVTVVGGGDSSNFPTTKGAYDTTYNDVVGEPGRDGFVGRLDPSQVGSAQLVYSTYLGGSNFDHCQDLSVDAKGVVTVAGMTSSTDFPSTNNAFQTTYGGGIDDSFVSQLDPSKPGSAQLVYSTYLGGGSSDHANQLSVDNGVVTVGGWTSSGDYPRTKGAFNTAHNGGNTDAFVSQLDPSKTGSSQLIYSTFLGGPNNEVILGLAVDAKGQVIVTGWTSSSKFPTTTGCYDTTYNGGGTPFNSDAFVSRLIPKPLGYKRGLIYSTFLGGSQDDFGGSVSVDANGVITVSGSTQFAAINFPTTTGAYDTTHNGGEDAFVSRLDPNKSGCAQLCYSSFLGGSGFDRAHALVVDASGVATVAGRTQLAATANFPTTTGAYDTTHNGGEDVFVSRVSMGVAFCADRCEASLSQGGKQKLQLDAGKQHAGRNYAIFGSVTGTSPGINLAGIQVPLNYDAYTGVTIASPNLSYFSGFRGVLDNNGQATAFFTVLPASPAKLLGITLYHAYLVHDTSGRIYMASNAVPLKLVK